MRQSLVAFTWQSADYNVLSDTTVLLSKCMLNCKEKTMNQLVKRAGKLMFGRYLLLTNTVSCSSLLAAGDMMTQTLEKWADLSDKRDWGRTGKNYFFD